MATQSDKVLLRIEDGVATVTLNRPEAFNALDMDTRRRLHELFEGFAYDTQVRVVVITGAGRAFCAGGDVAAMATHPRPGAEWKEHVENNIHPILRAMVTLEKPVIAMVNGVAAGGGCNLALSCDLIIAADNARFGQLFTKLGTVPDWGGAFFLPRLIGTARAKDFVFTNRMIDAAEAERIGLISRVVPRDKLEATVMGIARELARGPGKALGLAKTMLNRSLGCDLNALLALEADAVGLCMESRDFREGVAAFIEKRPPKFTGE